MNRFERNYILRGSVLLLILGLTASCTRSLSVLSATPSGPSFPTATNTPVFTSSPTPTGSYTATPTYTGSNTSTPTNTPTATLTFTPTAAPPTTYQFENWEGPYASGNMWAGFATCNQASFICNPWAANAAITTCYDSTAGDPHTGTYCWKSQITWTATGGQAQIAPDSAYGGDYGYPISIAASCPSSISIWLKSDTANTQFVLYFQDTSGMGSGSPLHSAYYQGGTGSNVMLTIPTANTWTHFIFPVSQANQWSIDATTMNWGSILDIGTVFQGPASGSFPATTTIYMDDYTFIQ